MEIPAHKGGTPGVTFVVSQRGVVIFTREYTRHVNLVDRSGYPRDHIVWGGIMTPEGDWVRRSFDFGDAPDFESREQAVELIAGLMSH